jgi:hypothetical protein
MKLGVALDGLLCDTEPLRDEWLRRLGDEKFLTDHAFWAALKPYSDLHPFFSEIRALGFDIYVFAERSKGVFLPTRAWLRNNAGLNLNKDRLILPAIKRYDCRLLGIDAFIDSDPAVIDNLKIETVAPVRGYCVDRSQGASLLDVLGDMRESICERP